MTPRRFTVIVMLVVAAVGAGGFGIVWFERPPRTVALSFETDTPGLDADERTLRSLRRVGNMHIVRYYGDYEDRLRWLAGEHLRLAGNEKSFHCSLFVVRTTAGEPMLGRNLDRRDTAVLAGFSPTGQYASFAFSPSVEVHLRDVLGSRPTEAQKNRFLYCLPFYPTDGINEKGLVIAIAGAPMRRNKVSVDRPPMFVLLFLRRVLDQCRSVEEAARFAEAVTLYDRAMDTISHHFLVVDSSGQWLVIDYPEGTLRLTLGRDKPVVRTNHFLEGGPSLPETRTSFSRYRKLEDALISFNSPASTREGMIMLKKVRDGTAWSVIYEARSLRGLVAAGENYRTHYQFGFSK